jgi:hypothetical protein
VLPDHEPDSALVSDFSRPTPAELTRVRLTGISISIVSAVLRDDLATVYRMSPRSVGDGAFLTVALAEVAGELIAATGRDTAEVVDELRGQTVRDQHRGGRSS